MLSISTLFNTPYSKTVINPSQNSRILFLLKNLLKQVWNPITKTLGARDISGFRIFRFSRDTLCCVILPRGLG